MTFVSSDSPSSSSPLPEQGLLKHISSPEDLQKLDANKLTELAQEIRHVLINSLAVTGGHLGPNLGVVELSIALHRVFRTPKDKFVFDVAHQGYVHKMLTGRANQIHTIRQHKGLNGFLLRSESEHDAYGAGHAGTALSAALGMASARDLAGEDNHVVAVAGDAAFTCGSTLEALNNIAATTKKFIVVLNDNEWSIDRNVGAIAKYFNDLQTSDTYHGLRQQSAKLLEKFVGKGARNLAGKLEGSAKSLFAPASLFEKLGIRYFGPIDGHDTSLLIDTFAYLKKCDSPVLLHIITEKGRGYQPALANPGKFHGLGPYAVEDGSTKSGSATASEVFARTVTKMAKEDSQITAITAAMPGGTKLDIFKQDSQVNSRYFDVGIAEEHAALFACGQATQGFKPFLAIYSTFMQRAFDMIIHDMAIQKLPVRLCMDRGGLSGDDGPTHHGLFDIGYLRHIPELIHMQPKDELELVDMLYFMKDWQQGPSAIRYPRGEIAGVPVPENYKPKPLVLGKAEIVADEANPQVALFGLGTLFAMAEETQTQLQQQGIASRLINPRFIKPLDEEVIAAAARDCQVICTFEDHVLKHGFGASIIELLHDLGLGHIPVVRIGWPDEFIEHGKPPVLREKHGLTVANALEKITTALQK